ncbi:MaoC family dehydratase N-terminal domain-containing protein [Pseudomonas sp. H9]|uniref:FAS1-like dehydratase domain-containing protein n=1 Tax=Pseudomonas sp. H9 TaxID=483968 RepID=UPI001057B1CE|nr:MaoC family dehydratase N-terminal domain-containing protein [Pseudomonas sp. H9]TDF80755.1 acyl dehydratase [Pseudomonas sp. H9]
MNAPTMLCIEPDIFWDDLLLGTRFCTARRTVTETDLVNFANLTWLTEELFSNAEPSDRARMAISARVVPGGLVYTFAEGLVAPSFRAAGLAFLGAELQMHGPTLVGDTLQVECEVIESRPTSKADRGLVRTRNAVVNQRGESVLVYTPLRLMRRRPA